MHCRRGGSCILHMTAASRASLRGASLHSCEDDPREIICFLSPTSVMLKAADCADDSRWRRARLTLLQFLQRQIQQGKTISLIFSIPGMTLKVFKRDWLHLVDQGVGADFIGNLFKEFIKLLPGANKKARQKELLRRMRLFYAANGVKDRMVGLKSWGIQAPKKPPKLKCSAACLRALIPFASQQCVLILDRGNPKHEAMRIAAEKLNECARCLSTDSARWREVLPAASKDFCVQYKALSELSEGRNWVIKPKMHQFLEMCISGSKPNMSWTYRDEDFGGTVAQLCRIKGGCWKKVLNYSQKMLTLFKTKHNVPRIGCNN
jgi:hypothetical protein